MRISDWSSDVCSSDLRHVVDSAQLLDWADRDGSWLDVGAGAGFPGMLVALLSDRPVALCEPRKRRRRAMVDRLSLPHPRHRREGDDASRGEDRTSTRLNPSQ